MSRENVELVRRIYEAVARRDSVTPFEIYAEDIVWDMSGIGGVYLYRQPVYMGHEGVREMWRESLAVFGQVDYGIEDLTEAGEKVLAKIRQHSTGRASGAQVDTIHFALWTLADGKVTRLQVFDDREQALNAAELGTEHE